MTTRQAADASAGVGRLLPFVFTAMPRINLSPPREDVRWLAEARSNANLRDDPNPFAYPTAEGGVQFAWTLQPWEIPAEVNLESRLFGRRAHDLRDHRAVLGHQSDLGVAVGDAADF